MRFEDITKTDLIKLTRDCSSNEEAASKLSIPVYDYVELCNVYEVPTRDDVSKFYKASEELNKSRRQKGYLPLRSKITKDDLIEYCGMYQSDYEVVRFLGVSTKTFVNLAKFHKVERPSERNFRLNQDFPTKELCETLLKEHSSLKEAAAASGYSIDKFRYWAVAHKVYTPKRRIPDSVI